MSKCLSVCVVSMCSARHGWAVRVGVVGCGGGLWGVSVVGDHLDLCNMVGDISFWVTRQSGHQIWGSNYLYVGKITIYTVTILNKGNCVLGHIPCSLSHLPYTPSSGPVTSKGEMLQYNMTKS